MSDANKAAIATLLRGGTCPFCGRGPFQIPASHILRTHGIGNRDLRDMAGLMAKERMNSDENHETRHEIAVRSGLALHPDRSSQRHDRMTAAGLAAQRERDRKRSHCHQGHPLTDGNMRYRTGRGGRRDRLCGICADARAERVQSKNCSVDQCGQPLVAREVCGKHYWRLRKYGSLDLPPGVHARNRQHVGGEQS